VSAVKGPKSTIHTAASFVGRAAEYGWLEGRLKLAAGGRPQVVLVSGDAGIGKTRLARELETAAAGAGLQVWRGRAREDLSVPYLPFEPLLAGILAARGPPERVPAASAIRRLLGPTSRSRAAAGRSGADAERLRVFGTITQALFDFARSRAVLIVLEDLHWADAASLDLLGHLTYAAADAEGPLSLLVLCTLRPFEGGEHLGRTLDRMGREDLCHTLELEGLDEVDLEALIRASGVDQPSRQLVGRIEKVTAGNPLFVQEILHLLEHEGALVERGGRWVTSVDPEELRLPERVTHAIDARIRTLSPSCREALATAACLGDRFGVEDLDTVAEGGSAELREWLEEGLRAHVLASHADRLHFAHPLLRRALYASASPARRRRTHRRIAAALECRHADDLEIHVSRIAHHWIRGYARGDEPVVLRRARLAAEQAFSVGAWAEAARTCEAALSVDGEAHALPERERADLHYRAALGHYRNMDAGPCLEHLERAIEIYGRLDDVVGLARALCEQARTYITLAPVPYGTLIDVARLEGVLERLGDEQAALRGWVHQTLSDVFMHARSSERAERCAREAIRLGRALEDDGLLAAASAALGNVQSQRLEVREALESYREGRRPAARSGDPWFEGWSLQRIPLALIWLGRLDEAEAAQREATRIAVRTGDWADHSLAMGGRATLALLRGELLAVELCAQETMALVRRSGYPWGGVVALTALYAARALRGEWAEAEDALAILEEPGRIFREGGAAAQAIAAVGRLRLAALSGRASAQTRAQVEGLSKAMQGFGPEAGTIGAFCAFVEIADLLSDPSLAEGSEAALELAGEHGVVFPGGGEFLLPRVRGVAGALARRWDAAEARFESAVEASRAAGARPDLARAELDYARMLLARGAAGDRDRAAERVERAIGLFREFSMEPFLRRAARMAEELGLALAPTDEPSSQDPGEPTRRELEVLEALALGRSDREICESLLLGKETVRRHLRTLFDKVGVDSRTGATAYAFERGLATPGGREPGTRVPAGDQLQVLLVSDIVRSTELIARLGDETAQKLIHVHNRIVRSCVRSHRGSEIQHTGDGFIVSFASAADAVRCAVAAQQSFARRARTTGDPGLRVRIGVHAGRVLAEEGRLFGVAINTAVRICSRAESSQVLVSDVVRALCEGTDLSFHAVGEVPLKGVEVPVRLHRVAWEEAWRPSAEGL
jgi:class 3 adenylate cyclase/tetratricopeptide (TPR) repeat protein